MAFSTASHFWMMITMLTLLTLVSSLGGGIRYRENFLEEVLGNLEDIRESMDYGDNPLEDMNLSESDINVFDVDKPVELEQPIEVEKPVEIENPHPTAKTPPSEVVTRPTPDFSKPPPPKVMNTPMKMPAACASNAKGMSKRVMKGPAPAPAVMAFEPDALGYASV